jgi:hypothetical protein
LFVNEPFAASTFLDPKRGSVIVGVRKPLLNRNFSVEDLLLKFQEYSDVTFELDDGPMHDAHRLILIRFEYFEKLLTSGFEESTQSVVRLGAITSQAFTFILSFIYGARCELPTDDFGLILHVYDKAKEYLLLELWEEVERRIYHFIDKNNVCKALLCTEGTLRQACIGFVMTHFDYVKETADFKELPKEVIAELLENAIKS